MTIERTKMSKKISFQTALIHAGKTTDPRTGAVNVPIYQTSTYKQIALGKHSGYEYSRTKNPTRDGIESLIAELEGGKFGFAYASGMAAIANVLSLFKSGDEIIILAQVYGGTFRLLDKVFTNFNITYKIFEGENYEDLENIISKKTKAILFETPSNPLLTVVSIEQIAKIAKKKGILSIIDNTFMTPYLQRPIELGIDIVVHSATKYIGGHSDVIGGLVVTNDEILGERLGFLQNSIGAVLAPFDSFLLIRGLKTLALRMQRHSENALQIAEFLKAHPGVSRVHYPSLKKSKYYETQKAQAKSGGGMVSFELKKGLNHKKFFESTEIITLAESLGGVESLLCHPASMTHASIPARIRKSLGISDELIRISVGIEDAKDLIKDLEQAILRSSK